MAILWSIVASFIMSGMPIMTRTSLDLLHFPSEKVSKRLGSHYGEILDHFVYGEHLSFDDLLKRIFEFQERFRALGAP